MNKEKIDNLYTLARVGTCVESGTHISCRTCGAIEETQQCPKLLYNALYRGNKAEVNRLANLLLEEHDPDYGLFRIPLEEK